MQNNLSSMTLLAGESTKIKQPRLLFVASQHRLELQTILLGGVGKKGFYGCVGWMALHHEHVNQLFGSFTSPLLQDNQRKRRADKEIIQGRKNPAADSGPWVSDLWIPL